MKCTKAIIPVAGYGTRRLPITKAIEKCMLPVLNRPVVDYVVQDCLRAGIPIFTLSLAPSPPSYKPTTGTLPGLKTICVQQEKKKQLPASSLLPMSHFISFARNKTVSTARPCPCGCAANM